MVPLWLLKESNLIPLPTLQNHDGDLNSISQHGSQELRNHALLSAASHICFPIHPAKISGQRAILISWECIAGNIIPKYPFGKWSEVTQSCLTLCDTMDCNLPGSSILEFSRQEYWSGLPFPSPGDLPNPGIEPGSPALWADAFTVWESNSQILWMTYLFSKQESIYNPGDI